MSVPVESFLFLGWSGNQLVDDNGPFILNSQMNATAAKPDAN